MSGVPIKLIVEGALLAAGEPVSLERLRDLFTEEGENQPTLASLRTALDELAIDYQDRSLAIRELASGFCFQVKPEFAPWIKRLWQERTPRYSRALLETLAVIAYRQPVTRAEIEDIRGVSVSSNIIKTLLEREWIRSVGQRDVPGKPSLYATTKLFLDYFSLKTLEDLPPLSEISDLDKVASQLEEAALLEASIAENSTEHEAIIDE
jgi:segregation and condensation protein B